MFVLTRQRLALPMLWLAASSGCMSCQLFPAEFEDEAAVDSEGSTGSAMDHEGDHGGDHGGVPAGGEPLELADRCGGELEPLAPRHEPWQVALTGLGSDFSDFSSCGISSPATGPDGYFAIDAEAGERWHIMVRPTAHDNAVQLHVLSSCDERACVQASSQCHAGHAQHMNFVAEETGRYFVGIEATVPDDPLTLLVLEPPCGDGTLQHGETCDDGNGEPGDGCDPRCRAELSSSDEVEVEPNDEWGEENVVVAAGDQVEGATVRGELGGECDFDRFSIEVPEGASVRAVMRGGNAEPCSSNLPPLAMELRSDTGRVPLGRVDVPAGEGCPSIDAQSFASNLPAGTYTIIVSTGEHGEHEEYPLFTYALELGVVRNSATREGHEHEAAGIAP